MASNILLSVEKLSLLGALGQELLATLSFDLASGDRLGIIGASGAGKTTLLRLLVRLQEPSSGQIHFKGQSIKTLLPLNLRRQIVLVPQEPRLLSQKVKDALIYPLQLQNLSASYISKKLDFWRSQLPFPDDWLDRDELQLSLGQRQWVSILRGIMMEPQILLLDEPTSALDPDRAHQLITVLKEWTTRAPVAVIMVNHQREWIELFAQRVIKLEKGQDDDLGSDHWD